MKICGNNFDNVWNESFWKSLKLLLKTTGKAQVNDLTVKIKTIKKIF